MRKLLWFTVGFGAASVFCAYGGMDVELPVLAVGFAALAAALLLGCIRFRGLAIPALVLVGMSLGLGWFQVYSQGYLADAEALQGQIGDVTARCTGYSFETDYGTGVDGFLYLNDKPYRARFYVSGAVEMEPGDVLIGAFRFKVTAEASEWTDSSYPGKGVFLVGIQHTDARLLKLEEPPLWAYPAMLRQKLLNVIDTCFPADTAAFAKALLLGERREIGYETNSALQISGILHIIAVSGMHVTILFSLIYVLCFKRRWLVALIGLPALGLFAVMGGLSPSIVRACIMQGLFILAMLFDRDYDGPTELSFASLVMLLANPLVITSVSFQLSVGCMAGIFLFQKQIRQWLLKKLAPGKRSRPGSVARWIAGSVSMTLSAMSLTTPLVAWHFGAVSLVGPLTNLLTLWVISVIFYGIILVCLAGCFYTGVGTALGWIVSWPIRYVLWVARLLSAFPLAAVYTVSVYITAWLVFSYVLFALFLCLRRKNPGMFAGCVAVGLCLALAASWIEPMTDSCRLTVLNVGQGQSILWQSEGKTYLIDCGSGYSEGAADSAAEMLLSQGIARLDGVILTHFDEDHSGGVGYLLSRIPADTLFLPGYEDGTGRKQMLEELQGSGVYTVEEDIALTYGTTKITIFAPVVPDSGNESSLAVLLQRENCDILITGDRSGFGERILLKTARLPEVDILIAGHHGSKHSTCEELLEAVKPKIVAISVGDNNYGHPAPELLDRLTQYGCSIYRTDIHGNLIFRR